MASELQETKKLKRRVLEAAALGSVKLLRGLVDTYHEYIAKGYRKRRRQASKKLRRMKGEHAASKSSSRHRKKRWRSGGREARYSEEKRRWKETQESEFTDSESSNSEEAITDSSGTDTEEKMGRKPIPSLPEIVNAKDVRGLTPLHHACYAGSDKAVKYLISKGASVHFRDERGNTPLHIAAKLRLASLVSLLVTHGADIEAFNDDSETPSDIMAKNEKTKKAESDYVEQQRWYNHLADEMSADEWWGESFSEPPEPQEWESILETMAEKCQAKGLYDDDFVSGRCKTRQEKVRTEKKPEEKPRKDKAGAAYMGRKGISPEEVDLPKNTTLVDTRNYHQRWQNFSKSYNLCLSYADVPFPVPVGREETLVQVLLQGIHPSLHRDVLRKEILKWHPGLF